MNKDSMGSDKLTRSIGLLSVIAACIFGSRINTQMKDTISSNAILRSQLNNLRDEFETFKSNIKNTAPIPESSRKLVDSIFTCSDDGWCTAPDHHFLFPKGIVVGTKNTDCTYGSAVLSVDGKGYNCPSGVGSVTFGDGNFAGKYAVALGGTGNKASGEYSSTFGGYKNTAKGKWSSAIGGDNNLATAVSSLAVGGNENKAIGDFSVVIGGDKTRATGKYSAVIGRKKKGPTFSPTAFGECRDDPKFSSIITNNVSGKNCEWLSNKSRNVKERICKNSYKYRNGPLVPLKDICKITCENCGNIYFRD